MNISKLCKKNYLCLMLAVIMIFLILPKAELLAEEKEDDYVNIIQKYYECINKSNIIDIHNLYGKELNDFVGNFFIETDNVENHKGIYNIKNVDILSVQKVGTDILYQSDKEFYSNVNKYLIKCNMNVYVTDKYYQEGVNYFIFYVGMNDDNNIKIADIEIPSYNMIIKYDSIVEDAQMFQQVRNELIYGIGTPYWSDRPLYIDYVLNPISVKVEGYSEPIAFWDYIRGVAANEINTFSTDNASIAGAMAIKMYTMHAVNTKSSGTDYDIDRIAQNYNPNTQISVNAANAVNYIQNYFMLGDYGENFKSFYYQKFNENSIIGKFAYENGGVLSHLDTEKLGKSGYTWQEILEYYYTKRSGIDYFPNAKQSDGIIITTGHIHDWSNALYCPYCGAEVY